MTLLMGKRYLYLKIMGKTALLIVFFNLLCVPDLIGQNYIRTSSFLYSFSEGSDLLEEDCGDNKAVLLQMEEELTAARSKIEAGNYHLLIVSHVSAFNYSNRRIINKASCQASYLRAYIISRLSIPEECIAFYIDRSGDFQDKVHVYLVRSVQPVYANKIISFSEDESPEAMQKAVARYRGVPYMNLYRKGKVGGYRREVYAINDPLFDRSEVDDYRLAIPVPQRKEPAAPAVAKANPVKAAPIPEQPKEPEPSVNIKPVRELPSIPRFGVSTNLLYWAALTPNLTLDGYFGHAFFLPYRRALCRLADQRIPPEDVERLAGQSRAALLVLGKRLPVCRPLYGNIRTLGRFRFHVQQRAWLCRLLRGRRPFVRLCFSVKPCLVSGTGRACRLCPCEIRFLLL